MKRFKKISKSSKYQKPVFTLTKKATNFLSPFINQTIKEKVVGMEQKFEVSSSIEDTEDKNKSRELIM